MSELSIPLSAWADTILAELAAATGSDRIAALDGATLLGERARLNGFRIPGRISAGGGCRLIAARDGWIALNLARPDDRELLPALFRDASLEPSDDAAIDRRVLSDFSTDLVARGRELGLAIAAIGETDRGPAWTVTSKTVHGARRPRPPLVVDLSALWAGPLASHLLWLAGAQVVKVESRTRPDSMREGDPGLFTLLNQGKDSVLVDLRDSEDRAALIALIRRADIVIEAARPRALLQLGIDADQLVRDTAGLVWMTITGHGISGDAANWVGFGDDCGVAGGLSAALAESSGTPGFVGDAIADPLTGILAGQLASEYSASGRGARILLSMRGVVGLAIEAERKSAAFDQSLGSWARAVGQPFPTVRTRMGDGVRLLGSDTQAWLGDAAPC